MLQKAIKNGRVALIVEKCPFAPRLHIPLTKREKIIVDMIKNGSTIEDIESHLSVSKRRMKKITKELKLKGINLSEILPHAV